MKNLKKYERISTSAMLDMSLDLITELSFIYLISSEVIQDFNLRLTSNNIWINEDHYLSEDLSCLNGFWRFEISTSWESVQNVAKLPEEVTRLLSQQAYEQSDLYNDLFTIQEIYAKKLADEKVVFGIIFNRDKKYKLT